MVSRDQNRLYRRCLKLRAGRRVLRLCPAAAEHAGSTEYSSAKADTGTWPAERELTSSMHRLVNCRRLHACTILQRLKLSLP